MRKRRKFPLIEKEQKCLLFALISFTLMIYGSNIYAHVNISRTVNDSNNRPLIGVNVMVKGSQKGIITNNDGKFVLTIPKPNAVIEFSNIGFQCQEILLNPAKGNRSISQPYTGRRMLIELFNNCLLIVFQAQSLDLETDLSIT